MLKDPKGEAGGLSLDAEASRLSYASTLADAGGTSPLSLAHENKDVLELAAAAKSAKRWHLSNTVWIVR